MFLENVLSYCMMFLEEKRKRKVSGCYFFFLFDCSSPCPTSTPIWELLMPVEVSAYSLLDLKKGLSILRLTINFRIGRGVGRLAPAVFGGG